MMTSLIILGVLIPFSIAFLQNTPNFASGLDYFTISIFSIDIIVTLNTGIYIQGEYKYDRIIILKQYMKFWLWLDLITTIPFELILEKYLNSKEFLSAVTIGKSVNILKIIKLLKLLRLSKLKYMIMKIEDQISSKKLLSFLKVMKSMLYLFLVAHLFASLMFIVSSDDFSPDSFAGSVIFSENGFETDPVYQYITCLYWAFATMACIGYGDYSPQTISERALGIAAMNVSSIVFGYIIGDVGSVIEKHTSKDKERREKMVSLNKYMEINGLSHELKRKARKYINYIYTRSNNRLDLKELLGVLSQPLREEIYSHINGSAVLTLKFLKEVPKSCISRISRFLKPEVNSPNEMIFVENEESVYMYFITKGCVEILDWNSGSCIKILSDKSFFGEIGLFTYKTRCASAQSVSFLETLTLSMPDLNTVSKEFPELHRILQIIIDNCSSGDLSLLLIECYLCKSIGHISKNCKKMTERENLQKK